MNKDLKEKITVLVKERCNELLAEPSNINFDPNSFIIGYLYGATDKTLKKLTRP